MHNMGACSKHCLREHLSTSVIQKMKAITNWKGYLINMATPYEQGKIEGGPFCFQWLCIVFNANIRVWSSTIGTITSLYLANTNYSEIYDILSFDTKTSHIHYEPMIMKNYKCKSHLHCNESTTKQSKRNVDD